MFGAGANRGGGMYRQNPRQLAPADGQNPSGPGLSHQAPVGPVGPSSSSTRGAHTGPSRADQRPGTFHQLTKGNTFANSVLNSAKQLVQDSNPFFNRAKTHLNDPNLRRNDRGGSGGRQNNYRGGGRGGRGDLRPTAFIAPIPSFVTPRAASLTTRSRAIRASRSVPRITIQAPEAEPEPLLDPAPADLDGREEEQEEGAYGDLGPYDDVDDYDQEEDNTNAQCPSPKPTAMAAPASNPFGAAPSVASPSSVFGQPSAVAFGQPSTTAFGQPSAASPFGKPSSGLPAPNPLNPFAPAPVQQQQAAGSSLFAVPGTAPFGGVISKLNQAASSQTAAPMPSPFGTTTSKPASGPSVFGATTSKPASAPPGFGTFGTPASEPQPTAFLQNKPSAPPAFSSFGAPTSKPNPFDSLKNQIQPPAPAARAASPFGQSRKSVHFADDVRPFQPPKTQTQGRKQGPSPQPSEGTAKLSAFAAEYAQKIHTRLDNDGLTPPRWPDDPGNPKQRPAMDKLKETYKKYRAKVYSSLRKAELIDDPDKRRRLEDALPFKGICEDMCPDYEQVTRITEFDVNSEEKEPGPDGTPWPEPGRMVKKFGRSAAGQDAPLPMDVRSVDALKRSTDYLLGELLQTDRELPALHNYLWDRTRAVRKDFTFHSTKSSEEMKALVYCFEVITRFHLVSLHLLSKKGVASDDFEEKQEIDQLGRSLLSLMEAYDDCHDKGVTCDNEAEFRAYYLLLNAHDQFVMERSQEWEKEPWYNSPHIEVARSLLAVMQSFDKPKGPFSPALGSHFTAPTFTKYFEIVEGKNVSYTMACMAEVHFIWVRQRILQSLVKGFARRRDWPKDITPSTLNSMLRFDTDEEAVEFAELHEFEFETRNVDGRQEKYMLLRTKRKNVPSPRVAQSHSATIVEAKRSEGHTLAEVFRKPIYQLNDIVRPQAQPTVQGSAASSSNPFGGLGASTMGTQQVDNTDPDEEALNYNGPMTADGDDMFVGNSAYEDHLAAKARKEAKEQQQAKMLEEARQKAVKATHQPTPSPFGAPTPSALGAKVSGFAPAITSQFTNPDPTTNGARPLNGILKSNTASTPPPQPSGNPFAFLSSAIPPAGTQASSTANNPFKSLTSTPPQSLPNSAQHAPVSQPAQAPETSSGFSILGATHKQTPGATPSAPTSNFGKMNTPTPSFTGLTPGGSQFGTFGASTSTPSSTLKDGSTTTGAKTPPSAFSSIKTTPPSGGFFPSFSTPAKETPSFPKPPAGLETPGTSTLGTAQKSSSLPGSSTAPIIGTGTSILGSQPQQPAIQFSHPPSTPASSIPTQPTLQPPAPAPTPPQPTPDPMAGLTDWFVLGDDGLLSDFTTHTVTDILATTFASFQESEAARVAAEEDAASWAAARRHQVWNLSVKYFYRWREAARASAQKRILRTGKEAARVYWEEQRRAEKEERRERELRERRRKRREEMERMERMRNFGAAEELEGIIASAQMSRQSSAEAKLLASGVFGGMRDEKGVARRVVAGSSDRPATSSSRASLDSLMPPPSVTAARREGWKTRSLRERFSRQRSDSVGSRSGASTNFSQSLPYGSSSKKVTNFTRKRSVETSDEEPSPKRQMQKEEGKMSLHWDLRRRGLVCMPNGRWLPEAIAIPMQEGKRYPGIGDCGLGPGRAEVEEVDDRPVAVVETKQRETTTGEEESRRQSKLEKLARRFGFPPSRLRRDSEASMSLSPAPNGRVSYSSSPSHKRKRNRDDDDEDASMQSQSPPKKANLEDGDGDGDETQRKVEETRRMLRELNETMDRLDEDKPWFREQVALMKQGGQAELNGGVRDEGGL